VLRGAPGGPADALRAEQAQAAENARLRFLREVQTTAALAQPGIPAVYDTGADETTGDLYLVMQLLTGAELADLIAEHDYDGSPRRWPGQPRSPRRSPPCSRRCTGCR